MKTDNMIRIENKIKELEEKITVKSKVFTIEQSRNGFTCDYNGFKTNCKNIQQVIFELKTFFHTKNISEKNISEKILKNI